MLCAASLRAADVPIVLPPDAPSNVRLAAEDLAKDLGRLYPQDRFSLVGSLPTAGKAILLGQISDESVRTRLGSDVPTKPESFSVRAQKAGDWSWASSPVRMRAARPTAFTNCYPNSAAAFT